MFICRNAEGVYTCLCVEKLKGHMLGKERLRTPDTRD